MLIQVIIRLIVYTDQLVSRPNDLEESSSVQTQNHGIDNTVRCNFGFFNSFFFILKGKLEMCNPSRFFFILLFSQIDDKKFFFSLSTCGHDLSVLGPPNIIIMTQLQRAPYYETFCIPTYPIQLTNGLIIQFVLSTNGRTLNY